MSWKAKYLKGFIKAMKKNQVQNFKEKTYTRLFKNGEKKLYKYISLNDELELNEKKLSCLRKNQLYVSCPIHFNDAKDVGIEFEDLHNCLKKIISEEGLKQINKCCDCLVKEFIKSDMGVCCISEEKNSKYMWTEYGNNHNGFCIEYDYKNLAILNNNLLLPVSYTNNRVSIGMIISALIKGMIGKKDIDKIVYKVLTEKDVKWEPEHEWRIICELDKENRWKGQFVNVGEPNAIYIGNKVSDELRERLEAIARDKNIKCSIVGHEQEEKN